MTEGYGRARTRSDVAEWNGYFTDQHGFRDPEKAAEHACTVQGGYSSPLIEAGRMLRDGGIAAERARAWMDSKGYTDEDLRY